MGLKFSKNIKVLKLPNPLIKNDLTYLARMSMMTQRSFISLSKAKERQTFNIYQWVHKNALAYYAEALLSNENRYVGACLAQW
jgi:hypothetical protein